MSEKVCIVTGGTSGIGLATVHAMHEKGYAVYELSRRSCEGGEAYHISADVTKPETLTAAMEEILRQEDHVDVLINNAGFGISGAVEFTQTQDAKKQFEVNFFGMTQMTQVVLPILRRQGYGRIVNLSSVAGAIPIPFQTFYSASKAAINAYTMALANEVRPFGVEVCAVMPGDICTGFTAAREKNPLGDDVYQGRIARSVSGMERDERNGMRPETAGRYIASVATRRSVKPLRSIGVQYKLFCVLAKLLPGRLLNWLVGLIYAK